MNKTCTHCESDNTVKTEEQHLDTMRDYFCNDCDKDFTPTNKLNKIRMKLDEGEKSGFTEYNKEQILAKSKSLINNKDKL
jgi:transposase-like protein|tara:strand:+ start:642 stop:881 length:240 start_codon:yes stop_codon:yes gene_type:complete